jgi:hypothetical protein
MKIQVGRRPRPTRNTTPGITVYRRLLPFLWLTKQS